MFDWVTDALEFVQDLFYDLVDWLVDLATQVVSAIGLADTWDEIIEALGGTGGDSIIGQMLALSPIIGKLAHWDIIFQLASAQFSILASIVAFKISVKIIPTIW